MKVRAMGYMRTNRLIWVCVGLVLLGLGSQSLQAETQNRNKEAIERNSKAIVAIHRVGGSVWPDGSIGGRSAVGVSIHGRTIGVDVMDTIGELPTVKTLDLYGCKVSADALLVLRDFKELEVMKLDKVRIEDGDLKVIGALKGLRHLELYGARITDTGIAELKNLERLESLRLVATSTTVGGLAGLKNLKRFGELTLYCHEGTYEGNRAKDGVD